jgi:hypothetical protein
MLICGLFGADVDCWAVVFGIVAVDRMCASAKCSSLKMKTLMLCSLLCRRFRRQFRNIERDHTNAKALKKAMEKSVHK